ncbi:MAG: hypothetical protein JXJ04_08305 [Spirochaetales bacterium]|nr:hypothetical protein [Spirochaetales bacterium]
MNLTGDSAYLLSSCRDGSNWTCFGNPDSHTIEESAIDDIDVDMMLGIRLVFDQPPYGFIPVYTSLIMVENENEQSVPVVAYIYYQKFNNGYLQQVSVRAWDTNSGWYQLGETFAEINSDYPSIVAGDNNLPVVCYLTGADGLLIVRAEAPGSLSGGLEKVIVPYLLPSLIRKIQM